MDKRGFLTPSQAVRHLIATLTTLLILIFMASHGGAKEPEPRRQLRQLGYRILGDEHLDDYRSTDPVSKQSVTDTFIVYGGPGSLEGKFQTDNPYICDPQGWTSDDLTAVAPHWRASTTNASTMGAGLGNHAVICNHDGPTHGGDDYFGYGNNWDDWLVFQLDIGALGLDPAVDEIDVRWTFDYVQDTEPDYDWIYFDWSRNGAYQTLVRIDGSSYIDSTQTYSVRAFDSDQHGGIHYTPADYENGRIQLRVRVTSDGAWSDQDGLYPTNGRGACGLDDIRVYVNGTPVSEADWEPLAPKSDLPDGDVSGHDNGADTGTQGWLPTPATFVGDFAKLMPLLRDIDPCYENDSCQWAFIDDGTPPNNAPGHTTGGAVSSTWNYGMPGGWVVNYEGGLTSGDSGLRNYIVSPEIEWDLPGTQDDSAYGGVMISGTAWLHLPWPNGIWWTIDFRSYRADLGWSEWRALGWGSVLDPGYWNFDFTGVTLLVQNPERVQVRLGVVDLKLLIGISASDATPAPWFDNITLRKWALAGPWVENRTGHPYDRFPTDGQLLGPVRFDPSIPSEDSIVVHVEALIPGTALADTESGGVMKVAMLANPNFGDLATGPRSAALSGLGAVVAGQDSLGWPIYLFEVAGEQSTTNGIPVEGNYFFDLPDGPAHLAAPHQVPEDPLLFSGDIVHYYVQFEDDQGNVSTLPHELSGFLDFDPGSPYHPYWTMRAMPTPDDQGNTPPIIIWSGNAGNYHDFYFGMAEAGYREGVDYDHYRGAWIAGPNGPTLDQLSSYEGLIAQQPLDPIEAVQLTQWHQQPGPRYQAWFGRGFAEQATDDGAETQTYLNSLLGAGFLAQDVRPLVEDQVAPLTQPQDPCFTHSYTSFAGCPIIERRNRIEPFPGTGVIAHEYLDRSGVPFEPSIPASTWWAREELGFPKVTGVFPVNIQEVYPVLSKAPTLPTSRARLMLDILTCWGLSGSRPAVGTDPVPSREFAVFQNFPNPFNPRTVIAFESPWRGHVSIRVYNVRGELVSTLLDETVPAGSHEVSWDGRDDDGGQVSSGTYFYRVKGFGRTQTKKMALLK